MRKIVKWGCLTPFIAGVILIVAAIIVGHFIPSTAREALPQSATEIQEYYSDCWNGDYVRCLKAKLPETDYPIYAKNLGLTTQFDSRAHADIASTIGMSFSDAPNWWNPPTVTATSYFRYTRGDDFLEVLKYANGYVYYVSTSW